MPGSTWAQKLSGSTVLFVVALVCFIIGWVTKLQVLLTIAYVLFIVVALMGLYALCFTTKLSKGSVVMSPPPNTTVVHVNPPQYVAGMYHPSNTGNAVPPAYTQSTAPGFHPGLINDQPPSYSAAVKQPYPS